MFCGAAVRILANIRVLRRDTSTLDATSGRRDKVTTVRRSRLGTRVGVLDDASILRLNRALVVFLGIAGSVSGD